MDDSTPSTESLEPHRRRGKAGARVFALGFAVATLGWMLYSEYQSRTQLHGMEQSSDLTTALIYYAKEHCGRIPDSPAAFRALPYVCETTRGSVRIDKNYQFRKYTVVHGVALPANWESLVDWGAEAADFPTPVAHNPGNLLIRPIDDALLNQIAAESNTEKLAKACAKYRNDCTSSGR